MVDNAAVGDWVQVGWVVLQPGERAPQVPQDTSRVPLEALVKGTLIAPEQARKGGLVTVRTMAGRLVEGRLVAVNPGYTHGFGNLVPPIHQAGLELRESLSKEAGRGE